MTTTRMSRYNEFKAILIGAVITTCLLFAFVIVGDAAEEAYDRTDDDPVGAQHRDYCENYCEECDAFLYEIETLQGGLPICHCAIPDPE